jgi:TonB-linked SusC/RagA family outer membrane protein
MKNFIPQWLRIWKPCLMLLIAILFAVVIQAQVKISGKVTGKNGEGIPGVSVVVKNTTFGTATDASGNYQLNATLRPGKHTLQFTGVGFKTNEHTLDIGAGQNYISNVQLADDALGLDEIVVTGASLGTTRKQLGSYISTINADQLNKGASGNVLQALQGKTAGAQITQNSGDPAGGISVRLRGISSVLSSSEPLYIVDGVIVNNATTRVTNTQNSYDGTNFVGTIGQNRMVDINPADIDHIEVLNGAAAAAIYGSRANAGVIQIFTKKGTSGAPQINFSTSVMSSELRKKLAVNRAPTKFGGSPDVFTQDIITAVGIPAALPTNTTAVTRYDYQDYIFTKGIGTDNNISVSGGTDKAKYYLSGSYFYNEGIIKNTDFRRFSFRANVDQTINKVLSFNMGLNYINSASNEKPDGNAFFSPMNSVTIIGNFHDLFTRDFTLNPNGSIKAVGERGRVNPVSVIEDFKQHEETNRIIASLGMKVRPFAGLTFDYTLGIDNYGQNGTTYMPPFDYNVNTAFFGGGASLDPTLNGYTSTGNDQFFQINNELNGTYQFNITNDIGSTTQVGYSVQYEKNRYSLLQGRGLAPIIQTINGASTPLQSTDERSEISVSGAYLQQNFRIKNKLFLTGAVRLDGSSVFGESERNQVYYKASGSYLLSDNNFWKSMPWWNVFKIRAAYGESGNLTGIGAYDRINSYSSNSYLNRIALSGNARLANESVKPERQKELEIGTDMSFFKDRIGLQFNWYRKRVEDLLINRQIAPTNGYSSLLDNFGSLENKGFEIVLNGSPFRSNDVRWDITAIYNHNRNKVLNVGKALTLFSTNGGAPVALLQGYPVGIFYGTFFAVDANGNMVKSSAGLGQIEKGVQNSPTSYTVQRDATTGLPTGTTLRKVIGDPNPDYTASLVNEFGYKKFNFRIQLDAVQGVDVFNADFRTRQGVGNGKEAEKEHLGIYPRGYINSIYQIEQWRMDDGSFVKLREVSLSYSFGGFKFFKDLSISFSGRNLISWDNYKGYDPELNAAGQSTLLRGIDFGAVPIPRTFKLGINARF